MHIGMRLPCTSGCGGRYAGSPVGGAAAAAAAAAAATAAAALPRRSGRPAAWRLGVAPPLARHAWLRQKLPRGPPRATPAAAADAAAPSASPAACGPPPRAACGPLARHARLLAPSLLLLPPLLLLAGRHRGSLPARFPLACQGGRPSRPAPPTYPLLGHTPPCRHLGAPPPPLLPHLLPPAAAAAGAAAPGAGDPEGPAVELLQQGRRKKHGVKLEESRVKEGRKQLGNPRQCIYRGINPPTWPSTVSAARASAGVLKSTKATPRPCTGGRRASRGMSGRVGCEWVVGGVVVGSGGHSPCRGLGIPPPPRSPSPPHHVPLAPTPPRAPHPHLHPPPSNAESDGPPHLSGVAASRDAHPLHSTPPHAHYHMHTAPESDRPPHLRGLAVARDAHPLHSPCGIEQPHQLLLLQGWWWVGVGWSGCVGLHPGHPPTKWTRGSPRQSTSASRGRFPTKRAPPPPSQTECTSPRST